MADTILDAKTVLAQLEAAGHDYTPDKQRLRADLYGKKVRMKMPRKAYVEVDASQADHFAEKGMIA